MAGRGWGGRIAVLCATVWLLAACTAGPSTRPGIVVQNAPEPDSPAPTTASKVPPLEEMTGGMAWRDCSDDVRARLAGEHLPSWLPVDCGKLNAVLDSPYAPGRGIARLQLLRAGRGPVPLVVVNDVTGLPGSIYAARLAASLPREFTDKFSLIGMDRRGTGNSAAARCVPEPIRRAIIDADPAGLPIETWLESAQTAGQQCSITLESQLPALDTWRTSADLETLREALGVSRLSGIGHGEGSRVLSVFADRFPDRVGRLVLDGVPDPTQDAATVAEGVAKGAEAALDTFATDCVNRHCELGADPKGALRSLLDGLRRAPLTSRDLDVTAGSALHAVLRGLGDRDSWPALSAALAKARDHDPSGLVAMLAPIVLGSDAQAATLDAELVIGCNDTTTRLSPDRIRKYGTDWRQRYPTFGALLAQPLTMCSPWTVPSQPLPVPSAHGAPPIVVIGTASDAVTPEEGSKRAAQQLSSGVYLSWQGGGHGALGFSPCATDAAVRFLTDAKVPHDGTVCPP